jgi:LysM domain
MTWSKLGLLVPALTLGWLATASAVDEAAQPAADGTVAQLPADDPAALPQPAAVAEEAAPSAPATDAQPAAPAALDAPGSEPAAAPSDLASDAAAPAAEGTAPEGSGPVLGAIGYDSQGHQGRIHIVRSGDTLWDISDAYLGTPWVWPSIWHDNGQVENPHRIYPGDRIWITPNEMRKISAEEAAALLANLPPGSEVEPAAAEEVYPVAPLAPAETAAAPAEHATVHVSARESTGLITPEQYEAASSIVGRVPERVLLTQEDQVYIGLGEGAVAVGDQLTVFRNRAKVMDPDTGRLLGYHIEFVGWVEVTQTMPETSLAKIRMSTGEVEEGDRVTPRKPLPQDIPLLPSPADVEGKITFFPQKRVVIGWNDFVYLNRGAVDGLEVGSPLEVFRTGYTTEDHARDEKVHVPDRVVAKLVVVRTSEETAVALVTKAETELELGDKFRGAPAPADAEVN